MRTALGAWRVHPAVAGAMIVLCLALILGLFWQVHVVVLEVVGLIALGLAFRYWPPMIGWFARLPGAHQVVSGLILAAMVAGHFTLDTRRYFPFVTWEIFSFAREEDPVTCREFVATTRSGHSARLLVEQLFPSIIQFNPPAEDDSAAMDALIETLARAYDRTHADDPVVRVDLVRMSVKLHPPADSSPHPPSCELLKRFDVSSVRSI